MQEREQFAKLRKHLEEEMEYHEEQIEEHKVAAQNLAASFLLANDICHFFAKCILHAIKPVFCS